MLWGAGKERVERRDEARPQEAGSAKTHSAETEDLQLFQVSPDARPGVRPIPTQLEDHPNPT